MKQYLILMQYEPTLVISKNRRENTFDLSDEDFYHDSDEHCKCISKEDTSCDDGRSKCDETIQNQIENESNDSSSEISNRSISTPVQQQPLPNFVWYRNMDFVPKYYSPKKELQNEHI